MKLEIKTLRELGLKHYEVVRKYQDATKLCDERYVSVNSLKDLINSANFYEDIVKQIEKELETTKNG